jgi:hypothetical protein
MSTTKIYTKLVLLCHQSRVHKIYEETIWKDSPSGQGFSGMGFIIKKIVVHRKPTPVREGEVHYNMDRASWDVRNLLEVFSREFTHKVKFDNNQFFLIGQIE